MRGGGWSHTWLPWSCLSELGSLFEYYLTFTSPLKTPYCCSDFTDLKLVLDSRTYENFEGGWRDLLIRIKWDTVKSVLKSVTGLQGRKFKVREV